MPRCDQDRVIKLISELRKALSRLQALGELPEGEFLADPDKVGSAKYHFIVAIESCIDICNHLISRNGYRAPEGYADAFSVMEEAGMYPQSFADDLRQMAKFRNRLVHLYWEVDDRQIHLILKTRLEDFKHFLNALSDFLGWCQEDD
jgi:uncharacterized protein YutE (UPF0331/DUF86 family)